MQCSFHNLDHAAYFYLPAHINQHFTTIWIGNVCWPHDSTCLHSCCNDPTDQRDRQCIFISQIKQCSHVHCHTSVNITHSDNNPCLPFTPQYIVANSLSDEYIWNYLSFSAKFTHKSNHIMFNISMVCIIYAKTRMIWEHLCL